MRIGEFKFRRRYSAAQIAVDVFSLLALLYLAYEIYICAADIEQIKLLNRTQADMSVFDWRPLLIWPALGVIITAVSFFLIFKRKKKPKKYFISKNNVRKYCNIIDTCISCERLIIIIALWELCYFHVCAILMRDAVFSAQLIFDALIAAGIIVVTRLRLHAVCDPERERAEKERAGRVLTED